MKKRQEHVKGFCNYAKYIYIYIYIYMLGVTQPSLLKSTNPKLFLQESAKNHRSTCQVAKNL